MTTNFIRSVLASGYWKEIDVQHVEVIWWNFGAKTTVIIFLESDNVNDYSQYII